MNAGLYELMRHYPALLGVVEEMLQGPSDTYLLGLRDFKSECWSVSVRVLVCLCV